MTISRNLQQISHKLAYLKEKLGTLEICETQLKNPQYLKEKLNDVLISIMFSQLKISHTFIVTPEHSYKKPCKKTIYLYQ